MSDKPYRNGGRFSVEQRKTRRDTCIDCPASLACMTRTVVLKRCSTCKQTYLGIMDPKGGLVDHYVLLDKKHARVCPQKLGTDKWSWVCQYCMDKRKEVAAEPTKQKFRRINLDDGYSGEDEW